MTDAKTRVFGRALGLLDRNSYKYRRAKRAGKFFSFFAFLGGGHLGHFSAKGGGPLGHFSAKGGTPGHFAE